MSDIEAACRWEIAKAYLRWHVTQAPKPGTLINWLAFMRALGLDR